MKKNKSNVEFIKFLEKDSNGNKRCLCKCPNCGNLFAMWASHYYRGSNSCKCQDYGKANPRLYSIWINMKTRCYNSNCPEYENYGGRGIKICNEWRDSFKNFLDWSMNNGYKKELTIDRINVNEGYSPKNCRWATKVEQARNRRNNITVDFASMTLKEFCNLYNLSYKTETTFYYRHDYDSLMKRLKGKMI